MYFDNNMSDINVFDLRDKINLPFPAIFILLVAFCMLSSDTQKTERKPEEFSRVGFQA
jgi:hypothetical protein